jgi:hypothetical protein
VTQHSDVGQCGWASCTQYTPRSHLIFFVHKCPEKEGGHLTQSPW